MHTSTPDRWALSAATQRRCEPIDRTKVHGRLQLGSKRAPERVSPRTSSLTCPAGSVSVSSGRASVHDVDAFFEPTYIVS